MTDSVAAVVMASGQSSRMEGRNKLLLPFGPWPLFEHSLRTVRSAKLPLFVVSCYPEILQAAERLGGVGCINHHPERGKSYSMQLGIRAAQQYQGVFFLQADQPFVSKKTLLDMKSLFLGKGDHIISAALNQKSVSPALFPRKFYRLLMQITGDHGGRLLLDQYSSDVVYYPLQNPLEAVDIDTPSAYQTYQNL